MKKHILLIVIFLIFIKCGPHYISQQEAASIAEREVISLGYDCGDMNCEISLHSEPWNKCLPKNSNYPYVLIRKRKLENRKYWMVYFYPISLNDIPVDGGDIGIFVDAKTGEVLTNYRGK